MRSHLRISTNSAMADLARLGDAGSSRRLESGRATNQFNCKRHSRYEGTLRRIRLVRRLWLIPGWQWCDRADRGELIVLIPGGGEQQ